MGNNLLHMRAKQKLEVLAVKIDARLEKYWDKEIGKKFGFDKSQIELVKKVLLHAKEHNLRAAKRVRASFVYYGYWLGGKKPGKEIWRVMEGVELVHTALLMHDDFMDEDSLRRGLPTTHEYFADGDRHYGESMAVSVGDVVLCLGFERVLECGLEREKVIKASIGLMRGIAETAHGQIYDVTLPKFGKLTEENILAVHRAKTSVYTFKNPLVMGAVLAGLSGKVLKVLTEYSIKGGVAFQLQDDILGMFGETEKTGKSVNSDLFQGKSTLLIAKTLEMGNKEQKKALLDAWGNKKADETMVNKAKMAIKESGSLSYSVEKAKSLAKEASEITKKLKRYNLNKEAIDYLCGIAEYLVNREV